MNYNAMNYNAKNLSRGYCELSETQKSVLAAVTYLIQCPEIYDQAKNGYGQVSADRVKEIYEEKRNADQRRE